MDSRIWAKLASESGYKDTEIAERCGVAEATVRTWRMKDNWKPKLTELTEKSRAVVEAAALDVDFSKKKSFPEGATTGDVRNQTHGLRSKAFKSFSSSAQEIIAEALNDDIDELQALQSASAISLALIAYFGSIRTVIPETSGQRFGIIRTAFR